MRKNRRQATGLAVSLFPFLAVLICTMGMLIVMLVLAVKSSAVKADAAQKQHADEVQQQRDELTLQLELEELRVREIAKLRPGMQDRLEKEKLRRSHMDDEIRKLVQDAKWISEQFQQLADDDQFVLDVNQREADKIDELANAISQRRLELQDLREEVAGRPLLYSIVPTRSKSGTLRRPIYVECTPTGIELQPSGIKIGLDEFTKPIIAGNPLDAALLATREYWNKFEAGSSEGEPYPLIVVRPGGATAYAVARRAMASWDDEFGYELVEAEKQLDWGESDLNLKETLTQSIQIAMQRQSQSVASGKVQWIDGRRGQSPRLAGGYRQAYGGQGSARSSTTSNSARSGNSNSAVTGNGQWANQSQAPGSDADFGDFDTSTPDSLSRFAQEEAERRAGTSNSGNPLRSGNESSQNRQPSGQSQQSGDRSASFAPSGATEASDTSASSVGNLDSDPSSLSRPSTGAVTSLAEQRGENWALPTRTPGATAYRRPIRVECNENHYLIYNSDPQRGPVRVDIDTSMEVSIDEIVNQVWKQIEDWGIAEIGGFWKPVLRLSAESRTGAVRADELAGKLKNSGIEIERIWR